MRVPRIGLGSPEPQSGILPLNYTLAFYAICILLGFEEPRSLGRHGSRLHVVAVQVLLEVQDRDLVVLRHRQQLAQSRIGLDLLLIHQVVGVGVGHDRLGHLRAADLRTLGLAQEGAQLVRDLHGLGEDAGLGLTGLGAVGLALAAALGLLDHARGLLLDGLQGRGSRGEGRLQAAQLLVELSDGGSQRSADILLSSRHGRSRGSGHGRGGGHRGRRGDLRLRGLGRLGLHLLRGGGGGRGGRNGGDGGSLGLAGLLAGRLRGGAHLVAVVRGSVGGHGTRILAGGVVTADASTLVSIPPKLPGSLGPPGDFLVEMTTTTVGMSAQCVSIRSREHPQERCPCRAQVGTEWCGKHKTTQRRFIPVAGDVIEHTAPPSPPKREVRREAFACPESIARAAPTILRAWRRWLARRAGPLLWYRQEANNPFDFFSADPVGEIPLRSFVSFVDSKGKGYAMDIASAVSLLEHAATTGETPMNPFNREPLPATFLRRVTRHGKAKAHETLKPQTEEQRLSLAVTDVFRAIEDLGYYTDPAWFMDLSRVALQRLYIELADIWYHRAALSVAERNRIVPPPARPFPLSPAAVLVMQQKALRPLLLETCKLLVSAAPARADKQTGVMYVLGGLCILSAGAGTAYPWLVEMFAPGRVTQASGNQVMVLHPSVLAY